MKQTFLLVAALLTAGTLIGCGGGSGNPLLGENTGPEQELSFGSLTTRVAGTAQPPVTSGAPNATVTGVAGGDVTSMALADAAPTLGETRIAFRSYRAHANGGLFTVNGDGTALTPVSTGDHPVWSPDGTRVAFVMSGNLYVRDLGGNATTVAVGFVHLNYKPVWSADSAKLAYVGSDGNDWEIYVKNANGTGTAINVSNDSIDNSFPAWSPSGTKIAYVANAAGDTEIFVKASNGTGGITNVSSNMTNDTGPISWSPDSDDLAWVGHDGDSEIYTRRADGGGATANITSNAVNDTMPAWSPNGTKIMFVTSDGDNEIAVKSASGGPVSVLTANNSQDYEPVWSPDSTKIAFCSVRDGNQEIYTMTATGASQTNVSNDPNIDDHPSWSSFVKSYNLIGTQGILGEGAAGFLFGRSGKSIRSVVTFDTAPEMRASARVAAQSATDTFASNLTFVVTADLLTALRFYNDNPHRRVIVLGTGGTAANATGAIIDFDAADGRVAAVLPYTANRAAQEETPAVQNESGVRVRRGKFLGVWDSTGKNLAPGGATEVRLNAMTGAVLSVQ